MPEEWLFRIIDCEEVRHDVLFPASDFAVEIYLTVPGACIMLLLSGRIPDREGQTLIR